MKKNKIVLFLALAMLGASVVPVYYWHKHSNDRFPSSVDFAEEDADETKYATPINFLENQDMPERDLALDKEREEEKEAKAHLDFLANHKEKLAEIEDEESFQAHLDFIQNPQEKIAKSEQVLCSTQEESLEDKVEKLLADKEKLLKEIALLKKKDDKEPKQSAPSKDHDKAIAHESKKDSKESKIDSTTALMMAQISQAMTSQQMLMQSQMQLMMMMQQQQQQTPESMYSKFAFDYYAFDAKERMYQRMAQSYYGYGLGSNLGGGIGIGYGAQPNQGMFSVSGQDVKPIPVNPMANYPYVVQPTAYIGSNYESYPMHSESSYGYMPNKHSSSFDFSNSSMTNKLERVEF